MSPNIFQEELGAFKKSDAEELFINSPHYAEWVMPDGSVVARKLPAIEKSERSLRCFLQDFAFEQNTRLDFQVPSAGGQWNGFRWQACIPPATGGGGLLSLRRVFPQTWTLQDFVLTDCELKKLATIFQTGKTLVVFGRPGAGKTSFVSALCHRFYANSRVLIFEDCTEIPLSHPRWIRLLKTQPDRHSGVQQETKDNIKSSLRLRPDAFVFGETRDQTDVENIEDARLAIPTTCLTTFHAVDPVSAKKRWSILGGGTEGIEFLTVPPRKKITLF